MGGQRTLSQAKNPPPPPPRHQRKCNAQIFSTPPRLYPPVPAVMIFRAATLLGQCLSDVGSLTPLPKSTADGPRVSQSAQRYRRVLIASSSASGIFISFLLRILWAQSNKTRSAVFHTVHLSNITILCVCIYISICIISFSFGSPQQVPTGSKRARKAGGIH